MKREISVGILALQGSFAEHGHILDKLKQDFVWVRSVENLSSLTHLIVPGGESTTLTLLLKQYGMWDIIEQKIRSKKLQVFGTCAGAILCTRWGLDVKVNRNAYGTQIHSFSAPLTSTTFPRLNGVFIRAPRFDSVGKDVQILATYKDSPVLIQQDNILTATFHPELVDETRIHEYFLGK